MRLDDEATETIEDTLDLTSAATAQKLLREALERRFDELDEFEDRNVDVPQVHFFDHMTELSKTRKPAHA